MDDLSTALASFWTASGQGPCPQISLTGPVPEDKSAFANSTAAVASAASVVAALSELTGKDPDPLDPSLVLANLTTHLTIDGTAPPKWAPLSGLYRTGDDRFVQLHCNFDHHAAGAAARLGVTQERAAFESAIAAWDAFELEAVLIDDGMICAAYRTLAEWASHAHAGAVRDLPLVTTTPLGAGGPKNVDLNTDQPLAGVRVLDCSRVLAGPAAGQTLANLGADVLRVGAAHLPHVELCVIATGTGKRNTFVDLRVEAERQVFADLVRDADVVIDAFRPGALASFGFSPEEIARVSPSTSVVQICAFDWIGPWAGRRGFDSIVQSTTGIALAGAQMCGAEVPTHLPVQTLDYATGFFAAASAIRAVHRREQGNGSTNAKLSLIRTRNWMVNLGVPKEFTPGAITPDPTQLGTLKSPYGVVELVKPFIGEWLSAPNRLGTATPTWRELRTVPVHR